MVSFPEALAQAAEQTETELSERVAQFGGVVPRLLSALQYASLGQGKRLRPFFVIESARMFGVPSAQAVRTGAALECVHCYSLVHDDLPAMDDDDLRRGKPTCHRQFDEATAILAGDGLLTMAFEILAGNETHTDPAVRLALVKELAFASGANGMVGGQMLDLEAEAVGSQSLNDIKLIQSLKTGALFRFALTAGGILGGADDTELAALRSYAEHVGLAFQIADDVLDVVSTPEKLGKATQKDAGAGKSTFIDLYGLEGARAEANRQVEFAIEAIGRYNERAELLVNAARFIVEREH